MGRKPAANIKALDIDDVPQSVIVKLWGVQTATVAQWRRSGLQHHARGRSFYYKLSDVIEFREGMLKGKGGDGGSPASERQTAEAQLLKMKLALIERRNQAEAGELIPREGVRATLVRLAAIIQGAVEILGRQYGQDAQDIVAEALEDFGRFVEQEYRDGDAKPATRPRSRSKRKRARQTRAW